MFPFADDKVFKQLLTREIELIDAKLRDLKQCMSTAIVKDIDMSDLVGLVNMLYKVRDGSSKLHDLRDHVKNHVPSCHTCQDGCNKGSDSDKYVNLLLAAQAGVEVDPPDVDSVEGLLKQLSSRLGVDYNAQRGFQVDERLVLVDEVESYERERKRLTKMLETLHEDNKVGW